MDSSYSHLPLHRKHPEPSLPPEQPPQASRRRIPVARNSLPSPSPSLPPEQALQAPLRRIPIAPTTSPFPSLLLPPDPLQSPQAPRRRIPIAPTTSPFPSPSLPPDPLQSPQAPRRRIPVAPTTSPFPSPSSLPPEQIHNISVFGTTASRREKNNEEEDYETEEDDYLTEEDDYYSEEDSYYSEDDDYFSGDDDDEKSRIILRVELNYHQRSQLCSIVEELPMPEMKHYVCTLMKSTVIPGEGKMEFSQEYTSAYLVKFLMSQQHIKYGISGGAQEVSVVVNCSTSSVNKYYRMSHRTIGWSSSDSLFSFICVALSVGMDEIGCFFCRQPLENGGHHSNRRAVSFEVLMMQGFEDGVVVPCKFREQVSKFARSENWMVAQCPMRVYDMYLEKDGSTTTICGPYWRSLVRLYDIQLGDVVSFTYMEEQNKFQLNVYQIVNNEKEEKPYVGQQMVYDEIPRIKVQLHKTIFTNIRAITEEHMAAITFGLTKVVMVSPTQELDDNEFYESTKELQFFVHIYNEENVHFDALYLNPKPFNHVGSPINGFAHLWKRDLEEPVVA
ncbi:hypothetical protein ACQ4PT_015866 [Festuca glaucescens]